MRKRVEDLERGDVVAVGGVEFVVEAKVNLPNGKTFLMFQDVPATPENMVAYGELLRMMKEWKEKDNEQKEVHGPASD